jgi:Flp pilus assembly protein TadD
MTEESPSTAEFGLKELAEQAEKNPGDMDLQRRYGWTLYSEKNFATARTVFEDAHTRWPDDIELNYGLGVVLRHLGDATGARESLQKAAASSADDIRSSMLKRMAEVQLSML